MTVFADGSKERLHGHNYTVEVALEVDRIDLASMIPFTPIKAAIRELCAAWKERVLLAARNPWMNVVRDADELEFTLCGQRYVLPRGDALLLPIDNTSREALAPPAAPRAPAADRQHLRRGTRRTRRRAPARPARRAGAAVRRDARGDDRGEPRPGREHDRRATVAETERSPEARSFRPGRPRFRIGEARDRRNTMAETERSPEARSFRPGRPRFRIGEARGRRNTVPDPYSSSYFWTRRIRFRRETFSSSAARGLLPPWRRIAAPIMRRSSASTAAGSEPGSVTGSGSDVGSHCRIRGDSS